MALKYRADIDGLRAIAVLSVIFFHTGILGFSGGFVGVDVFFVISGYLITSIILKEILSGKFSISRFYERRIRRIFPALFPVIAFTIVIATFLFDSISFESFGKSITATAVFGSNIFFWTESGYFDAASFTKPLLHTWSLAVEEQFYIFFPLLLIAINRFSKNRYLEWIVGICTISLLTSIYGAYTHQVATFYLVPTRAWELLFGSLLSLEVIPELKSNVNRNIVSIIGLGLIVFSVFSYNESTVFPGVSAIVPVLGSTLIIYSGIGGGSSIVKKLLSLKLLVFIGLISYSLYLWHWPLIVFSKYLIFRELTPLEISGIILASLIIYILSLKFIETSFRGTEPIIPNKKKLFILSSVIIVIFSTIGIAIYLQKGMSYRFSNGVTTYNSDNDPMWIKSAVNRKRIDEGKLPDIIGNNISTPNYVLWGDSHAEALITALSEEGLKYGISGYNMADYRQCRPLIGIRQSNEDWNEVSRNNNVIRFIYNHHEINTVIIAASWNSGGGRNLNDEMDKYSINKTYLDFMRTGLSRSINILSQMGCKIVLVTDVPRLTMDPNVYFFRSRRGNKLINLREILESPNEYYANNKNVMAILNSVGNKKNIHIVHIEKMFYDGDLSPIKSSNSLYLDKNHLTSEGSRFVAPIFDDVFTQIANNSNLQSR